MRWIVRAIALIVLIALTAAGALLLIPSTKIAQLAEGQFESATGRKITFSGAVHSTIWPQLGVRTGPVEIANADWAEDGPMLAAKGLEIGIDLASLFGGDIRLSKVKVLSPRILLERRKDGIGNWEFISPSGTAGTRSGGTNGTTGFGMGGGMQAFSLDEGVISDGSVTWIDQVTGQRIALSNIDATLEIPSYFGPANLNLKFAVNGKAMTLTGKLGEFANFIAGQVVPADLSVGIGPSTVGFKGNLGTSPLTAQGNLAANLKDPAALAALVGQAAPGLPKGLGRDTITVKGDVTLSPEGTMHLGGGMMTLDGNAVSVAADVTFPKGQPTINAQIGAGALDLSALAGPGGGGGAGSGTKAASGWSTAPIDASALRAMDAEVALTATSIDLGVAKLGQTRALITVVNGRAVADLRQVAAYGGTVTGQMVVNARSGLSVAANLAAKGVSMRPLLSDLADYQRLDAKADVAVKLLASGNNQAALARSLSGSGNFNLGKGELQGLDLLGMLRTLNLNFVGEGAKTIFDQVSASFTIDKGVLANNDLALKAPLLTAVGKGRIDIGAQKLNYTVTPTALSNADGTGGVSVPLDISGSWAKPKFDIDFNAMSGGKVDAAKKQLEDKARAEVAKKLGITAQDGQSAQDAIRKKLQDEATNGLLNLLK
ncbi:MAG: AsmA family protein [Cypionkella sp.]